MNDLEAVIFELWLTRDEDDCLFDYRVELSRQLRSLMIRANPGIIYPVTRVPEKIDPNGCVLQSLRGPVSRFTVAARSVSEMLGYRVD